MTRGTLVFITILRKEGLFPAMTNAKGEGHGEGMSSARWTSTGIGRVDRYQAKTCCPSTRGGWTCCERKDGTKPKGKDWQTGPKRWRGRRPARTKRKARRSRPNLRMKIRRTSFRALSFLKESNPQTTRLKTWERHLSRPSLRIQAYPPWKGMSRPLLTWKNRRPPFPLSERQP